ncbi:MAG: arginine repressor [Bdellovibrionaceae bacterium]|nr:arginine repressor [Pseudobdellovibrionaceae bacterium]
MKTGDTQERLKVLTELLESGALSTQEELAAELKSRDYHVTQSTISRDLRRIGAVKAQDVSGRTVYRLTEDLTATPVPSSNLDGLVLDMAHNGAMIVLHTTPGSASLVARHLDAMRSEGILGTIAGDDTIFLAPESVKKIDAIMARIQDVFALSEN